MERYADGGYRMKCPCCGNDPEYVKSTWRKVNNCWVEYESKDI